MARLALEHHILNHTVMVPVRLGVRLQIGGRKPSLNHTGLLRIGADIVELIPALQILFDQLPVKEDDRDILLLCHIDDFSGRRPVNQVHTDDVAAVVEHLPHGLVLQFLTPRGIAHLNLHAPLLQRGVLPEGPGQLCDKGIVAVIDTHADSHFLFAARALRCAAREQHEREQQ